MSDTFKKKISFSKVKFEDLREVVDIEEIVDSTAFNNWFGFEYSLSKEEQLFIEELFRKNVRFIDSFTEEELKARYIIPLVNKVDFYEKDTRDWYERPLSGIINKVLFEGRTDYMIAKGIENPQNPYFFIQEYKQTLGSNHPKNPLLAEMMVAMEINQTTKMHGAFIIGKSWQFVILKKNAQLKYSFHISHDFSALKVRDIEQIYVNLQAVKSLFIH